MKYAYVINSPISYKKTFMETKEKYRHIEHE